EPFRKMQEFVIEQHKRGMLICLCSKNNEKDVFDVFGQRSDMALQPSHLAAWRVNWIPKSQNIKSLAEELQLGLDSFIFIDDNARECAEVRITCPEVVVLRLPQHSEKIPGFLGNIWVFDAKPGTSADSSRIEWYQANAERAEFRSRNVSLKDFIDG